jgi:hypothetical protein
VLTGRHSAQQLWCYELRGESAENLLYMRLIDAYTDQPTHDS